VILVAALVLVGLTWGFTLVSIDTEEREARAHAEGNVANLARAWLPTLTAQRDWKTLATYALCCFAVAAILHRLVERPFLALRDRTSRGIEVELQQDPAL